MRQNVSLPQVVGIAVSLPIIGVIAWFFMNPGLFSKLQIIVISNPSFWFVSACGVGYAIYRKWQKPKDISWAEVPVQIFTTCLAIFMFYNFFFYVSTDLKDLESWNSYVTKAEYWEGWTEEVQYQVCNSTDTNGNCTSYRTETMEVYHPPEWNIITDNNETISVNQKVYRQYVNHFDDEIKKDIIRFSQISYGDGDMFYTTWSGDQNTIVPTAREHHFVNYLKGSQSIRKRGGSTRGFENLIQSYPRVYASDFGPIELNRVLVAGTDIPSNWIKTVDRQLDEALAVIGRSKEVNILVYIANTADQSFFHALEESWVNGKKNDVIIVMGMTEYPKIDWVAVMAWTKVDEFKIVLRNRILDLGTIDGQAEKLVDIIVSQISKSPAEGGFKRTPMSDMEYLAGDVKLPWWAQLIVICLSVLIAWATSWVLANNEIRS